MIDLGAIATGVGDVIEAEWGNDFVAMETPRLENATVLRTISDGAGNFEFLATGGRVLPPRRFRPRDWTGSPRIWHEQQ